MEPRGLRLEIVQAILTKRERDLHLPWAGRPAPPDWGRSLRPPPAEHRQPQFKRVIFIACHLTRPSWWVFCWQFQSSPHSSGHPTQMTPSCIYHTICMVKFQYTLVSRFGLTSRFILYYLQPGHPPGSVCRPVLFRAGADPLPHQRNQLTPEHYVRPKASADDTDGHRLKRTVCVNLCYLRIIRHAQMTQMDTD